MARCSSFNQSGEDRLTAARVPTARNAGGIPMPRRSRRMGMREGYWDWNGPDDLLEHGRSDGRPVNGSEFRAGRRTLFYGNADQVDRIKA